MKGQEFPIGACLVQHFFKWQSDSSYLSARFPLLLAFVEGVEHAFKISSHQGQPVVLARFPICRQFSATTPPRNSKLHKPQVFHSTDIIVDYILESFRTSFRTMASWKEASVNRSSCSARRTYSARRIYGDAPSRKSQR